MPAQLQPLASTNWSWILKKMRKFAIFDVQQTIKVRVTRLRGTQFFERTACFRGITFVWWWGSWHIVTVSTAHLCALSSRSNKFTSLRHMLLRSMSIEQTIQKFIWCAMFLLIFYLLPNQLSECIELTLFLIDHVWILTLMQTDIIKVAWIVRGKHLSHNFSLMLLYDHWHLLLLPINC